MNDHAQIILLMPFVPLSSLLEHKNYIIVLILKIEKNGLYWLLECQRHLKSESIWGCAICWFVLLKSACSFSGGNLSRQMFTTELPPVKTGSTSSYMTLESGMKKNALTSSDNRPNLVIFFFIMRSFCVWNNLLKVSQIKML